MPQSMPLAYVDKGQGRPILCLHGHPGSAACLSVFTDALSTSYRTIAPDLRGYGNSLTRSPFAMSDHLLDLEQLLQRLDMGPFIVLGWSLGGILALELALRHPKQVKGLILVASAARPVSQLPNPSTAQLIRTAIAGSINWIVPGWQWNIQNLAQRSLLKDLIESDAPIAYCYLAEAGVPAFLKTTPQAQTALQRALAQGYDRTPHLADIRCPSLVMAGECDRHITTAASLETAQKLPAATWISYPGTAHLFPWEIPARVQGDLLHWLQEQGEQLWRAN